MCGLAPLFFNLYFSGTGPTAPRRRRQTTAGDGLGDDTEGWLRANFAAEKSDGFVCQLAARLREMRDRTPIDLRIGKPRKAIVNHLGIRK